MHLRFPRLAAASILLLTFLAIPLLALLPGCQTVTDSTGKKKREWTPEAQQAGANALNVLGAAVLGAANASASNLQNQAQNGQIENIDTASLSASAIWGALSSAALQLRSLQSTPQAASPSAVSAAIHDSGNAPLASQLAPAVSAQIQTAVKQGANPSAANETAANALDKAAAKLEAR